MHVLGILVTKRRQRMDVKTPKTRESSLPAVGRLEAPEELLTDASNVISSRKENAIVLGAIWSILAWSAMGLMECSRRIARDAGRLRLRLRKRLSRVTVRKELKEAGRAKVKARATNDKAAGL